MFGLFKWSTAVAPSAVAPSAIPPPPPLPGTAVQAAASLDAVNLLRQIDSKLDIILTKLDAAGSSTKKKFTVDTTATENTYKPRFVNPVVNLDFATELARKVEQFKQLKHMGESHGWEAPVTNDPLGEDTQETSTEHFGKSV